MCRSMVDIQSAAAEIRRRIKKRKKSQGKNIMSASATQGGHNHQLAGLCCGSQWGAYSARPDHLAGGMWNIPSPRTPSLSVFRASLFVPSGLAISTDPQNVGDGLPPVAHCDYLLSCALEAHLFTYLFTYLRLAAASTLTEITRSWISCRRGTARRPVSVEILLTDAQLYQDRI